MYKIFFLENAVSKFGTYYIISHSRVRSVTPRFTVQHIEYPIKLSHPSST